MSIRIINPTPPVSSQFPPQQSPGGDFARCGAKWKGHTRCPPIQSLVSVSQSRRLGARMGSGKKEGQANVKDHVHMLNSGKGPLSKYPEHNCSYSFCSVVTNNFTFCGFLCLELFCNAYNIVILFLPSLHENRGI